MIEVGRLTGVFGVRGWVKLHSFTARPDDLLTYVPWTLKRKRVEDVVITPSEGKAHGSGLIVKLAGIDDRDKAAEFVGFSVWVPRSSFPDLEAGEYYWTDLIGLQVKTIDDVTLGVVTRLMETGANDVLVVKDRESNEERLIPFLQPSVVTRVDLPEKLILVDWDPDF